MNAGLAHLGVGYETGDDVAVTLTHGNKVEIVHPSSYVYMIEGTYGFDPVRVNVNASTELEKFAVMTWKILNLDVEPKVAAVEHSIGNQHTLTRHVNMFVRYTSKLSQEDLFKDTWKLIYEHRSSTRMKAYCIREVAKLLVQGRLENTLTGIYITFIVMKMLQDKNRGHLCQQLAKGILCRLYQTHTKIPNLGSQLEAYFQSRGVRAENTQLLLSINFDKLANPALDLSEDKNLDHSPNCKCGLVHLNFQIAFPCAEEKCMFVKLVIYLYYANIPNIILRITNMPANTEAHPLYDEVVAYFALMPTLRKSTHYHGLIKALQCKKSNKKFVACIEDGSPEFKFLVTLTFACAIGDVNEYPVNTETGFDFLSPYLLDFMLGLHQVENDAPTFEDICSFLEQHTFFPTISETCLQVPVTNVLGAVVYNALYERSFSLPPLTEWLTKVKDRIDTARWDQVQFYAKLVADYFATDEGRKYFIERNDYVRKFDGSHDKDDVHWQILRERVILEVMALCDKGNVKDMYIAMLLTAENMSYMMLEGKDEMALNLLTRVVDYIEIVWSEINNLTINVRATLFYLIIVGKQGQSLGVMLNEQGR
ncbi:hypothetical protein Ciccas_004965 [Cichlidogyrus casuarinus]|uniref:Uncharacterized protein n=1 Tax=Cichlidogyrus casuarinus TaxID=1844966 RepID=A0ABD2QAY0_9PLAT